MKKKTLMDLKNKFLLNEYVLNDDQLEQLIEEKMIRAREYQQSLKKIEERALEDLE